MVATLGNDNGGNMKPENIRKLRALNDCEEVEIDGAIWLRLTDTNEWKVSPHGKQGDFDRDAFFVEDEEIEDFA